METVSFGTIASPRMLNTVICVFDVREFSLGERNSTLLDVDNVFMTALTEEEAVNKYKSSKQIFAAIGMNLRSYLSNSAFVNSQNAAADRAPYSPLKFPRVIYNPVTDAFLLKQVHVIA